MLNLRICCWTLRLLTLTLIRTPHIPVGNKQILHWEIDHPFYRIEPQVIRGIFQSIHIPHKSYLTNSACFSDDLLHFNSGVCWGINIIPDHDFSLKKRGPWFQNKLLAIFEPRLVDRFMFIHCSVKVRPLKVNWKLL